MGDGKEVHICGYEICFPQNEGAASPPSSHCMLGSSVVPKNGAEAINRLNNADKKWQNHQAAKNLVKKWVVMSIHDSS